MFIRQCPSLTAICHAEEKASVESPSLDMHVFMFVLHYFFQYLFNNVPYWNKNKVEYGLTVVQLSCERFFQHWAYSNVMWHLGFSRMNHGPGYKEAPCQQTVLIAFM